MGRSTRSFTALLLAALVPGVFVFVTSAGLPEIVASHFGARGAADGFMPRQAYRVFMIGVTVGVPLLLVIAGHSVRAVPVGMINLPNRDYWLAPDRRAETITYLTTRSSWLGVMVAAFMCFVHWLVLQANRHTPPRLSEDFLFGGLGVFALLLVAWAVLFIGHFRRPAGQA